MNYIIIKNVNNKKRSGVLLPLFSLPGKYGIGSLGQYCKKFIDFLSESKFSYWEVLPINMTNIEGSPYNLVDAFGTNYLYIDIDELIKEGLLNSRDIKGMNFCGDARNVNYPLVFETHRKLLFKAYKRDNLKSKYFKECINNKEIKEYAIYMTLKEKNNFKAWYDWELEDRYYCKEVEEYVLKNEEKLYLFYVWTQAKFKEQWDKIHDYAKSKNISLVGEISHFLGYDSCQMYMHPELFLVDKRNQITHVSGFPKDEFSNVGQKWGNPLYDWNYMKQDNYKWWNRRISEAFFYFDYVKLNHFRAFYKTYAIPFRAKNALKGEYIDGPKYDFFEDKLDQNLISSDLGKYSEDISKFALSLPYPVCRTTILGYVSFERKEFKKFLPSSLPINSYSYLGNHDNQPILLALKDLNEEDLLKVKEIIKEECTKLNVEFVDSTNIKYLASKTIELLFASNANNVTLQFQDVLFSYSERRTNTPGTVSSLNWSHRFLSSDLVKSTVNKFIELNQKYNRSI